MRADLVRAKQAADARARRSAPRRSDTRPRTDVESTTPATSVGRRRRPSSAARPATSCCWPATSARARPRSPRASARPRRRRAHHQPDVHARARSTTAAVSRCTTSTCTGSSRWTRCSTSGLPELLDEGGVTLIEWGDAIVPALPADYLEVRLHVRRRRRRPHASSVAAGRPVVVGTRARALAHVRCAVDGWDERVLILGIETATAQVGVRHRRPRGRARVGALGARQAPRREPHAGDRVRAPPGAGRAPRDQLCRRRPRPGPVHRPARRHRRRPRRWPTRCGCPMIGVPSLDLLAFPVRFIAPADRGRDRRPAGRAVLRASTGRCPAACSGSSPHQLGTPDDLASELHGVAATSACSSATAPSATARRSRA